MTQKWTKIAKVALKNRTVTYGQRSLTVINKSNHHTILIISHDYQSGLGTKKLIINIQIFTNLGLDTTHYQH